MIAADEPLAGCGQDPISGAVRCARCSRHLLVGEIATLWDDRGYPRWTCEFCKRPKRTARGARPLTSRRVRSLSGAQNVRATETWRSGASM